jgi:hypothetical protein
MLDVIFVDIINHVEGNYAELYISAENRLSEMVNDIVSPRLNNFHHRTYLNFISMLL